jgi:hypothetical protein
VSFFNPFGDRNIRDIIANVKAIQEATAGMVAESQTILDATWLESMDFEPECEWTGTDGSGCGQSAAFFSCCADNTCTETDMCCTGCAKYARDSDVTIRCGLCGSECPLSTLRFIPLDGAA